MKFSVKKILLLSIFLLPTIALGAGEYTPLVGIPGVDNPNLDFNGYINALYILAISIAGLLAVIKIIIGGVKYMTTDIVTSKGEAKKDIQGAVIGLLVVLAAVLILTVINPEITDVDISIDRIDASGAQLILLAGVVQDGGDAFTFINTLNVSDKTKSIYAADCVANGGTVVDLRPFTNEQDNVESRFQMRCYKTGEGEKVDGMDVCGVLYNNECSQEQIDAAEKKCLEDHAGYNPRFVVQTGSSLDAACFYSKDKEVTPPPDDGIGTRPRGELLGTETFTASLEETAVNRCRELAGPDNVRELKVIEEEEGEDVKVWECTWWAPAGSDEVPVIPPEDQIPE